MNSLEQIVIDKIKIQGPVTFETFMDMALYYPGLGYYACPDTEIGKKGDFYTSPHVHPIFGAMIARQLMEMWTFMDTPAEFCAVEVGAGAGYLCKDIHDYLNTPCENEVMSKAKSEFRESLNYVIVEPYQHFERRQKNITNRDSGITWVQSLKELKDVRGCILSNELLDAFPVHLVEMDDELKEIYVDFDGTEFVEEKNPLSSKDISDYVTRFSIKMYEGYRTEINLRIRDWLDDAVSVLSNGFILTIDYGYSAKEYYDEDRSGGTLLCYHKHQLNENPYKQIGEQDITAHVNFSSLKKWGEDLGLKTTGYCAQGTYLTASGIDEVIIELYSGSSDYLSEISKVKGLILPQGMGESHSVMIQYIGDGQPELRGFSMRNLADML